MNLGAIVAVASGAVIVLTACSPSGSTNANPQMDSGSSSQALSIRGSVVIVNSKDPSAEPTSRFTKRLISEPGDLPGSLVHRVGDPTSMDCEGVGRYESVREGLALTVRDAAGTTVGVGRLSGGVDRTDVDDDLLECAFTFTVEGVAAGDFFTLQVGSGDEYPFRRVEFQSDVTILLR